MPTIDFSVIVDLIKNIVIAIMRKAGVFEDAGALGVDLESYFERLFNNNQNETGDETGV